MTGLTREAVAERYVTLFEHLSPDNLDDFDALIADDIHFRDPFSDVSGRGKFKQVLRAMYEDVDNPKFTVLNRAWDGNQLFLKWQFDARIKRLSQNPWQVIGMTEIHFAEDNRIAAHLDHWDAAGQFYTHMPLLGGILRWLRRRIGTH